MTTTTQHTPGPWRVMDGTDETGQHKFIQCHEASAGGVSGWGMVAKTCGIQPLPIKEANARLIAAAPDMLEALRAIADRANLAAHAFPNAPGRGDALAIFNLARNAYASATGGVP